MPTFAAVSDTVPESGGMTAAKNASLAQLARARDL